MSGSEAVTVAVDQLKELYERRPSAKIILDHFVTRQRDRKETTVDRLQSSLVQEGKEVSRNEIIEFFRDLERVGCGSFLIGRKGHPSRFEWKVGLTSVAQAAAGTVNKVEAMKELEGEIPVEDNRLTHTYVLRPGLVIKLDLPTDFSASEASRLAEFVKTLPFG